MTSISKFEGDYEDNVIRARGIKVKANNNNNRAKRKCHHFSLKDPFEYKPASVHLLAGKTIMQEWLFGPATLLETRTVIYPCTLFKCAVPCACKICRKQHLRCRVPSSQSCSCSDCVGHYQDHISFHGTFHYSCKHCFQLLRIFPCFSFFFIEKNKSCEKRFDIGRDNPKVKPLVATAEPKKWRWEKGWKRDQRPDIWCTECQFYCKTSEQMKEHIELNHLHYNKVFHHSYIDCEEEESSSRFKCYQCSSFYSSTSELNRHIDSVHYDESHQCQLCPQIFMRRDSLTRHISLMHSHAEEWACDLCGKLYRRWTDMIRHRRSQHADSAKFTCGICGTIFNRSSSLKRHTEGTKNNCTKCEEKFCNQKLLKAHIKLKHDKEKVDLVEETGSHDKKDTKKFKYEADDKIGCDDQKDNKKVRDEADETIDHTVDLKKQSVQCNQCGKTFSRQDVLVRHIKNTHCDGNTVLLKCEICDSSFNQLNNLARHKEGWLKYCCSICDKNFCTGKQLKSHELENHNDISCKNCGQKFSRKISLKMHLRKKIQLKCLECDKSFCYKISLKNHMNKMHSI